MGEEILSREVTYIVVLARGHARSHLSPRGSRLPSGRVPPFAVFQRWGPQCSTSRDFDFAFKFQNSAVRVNHRPA